MTISAKERHTLVHPQLLHTCLLTGVCYRVPLPAHSSVPAMQLDWKCRAFPIARRWGAAPRCCHGQWLRPHCGVTRAKCIHVRIMWYRSHPLRDIRVCWEADIRSFFEPTAANSGIPRSLIQNVQDCNPWSLAHDVFSKHVAGYKHDWECEFLWLQPVERVVFIVK